MMSTDKQDEGPSPAERDRNLIADARRQVEQIAEKRRTLTSPAEGGHGDAGKEAVMTSDLPPPGWISGYEIVRRIHGGGQGVVYEAVQVSTQRKVAVKVLHEGPFASPHSRERFKREIGLVAGLDHPHIVKVLDSGIAEGRYFYAMDYVRGGTLSEFVKSKQPPLKELLSLFAKICEAVQYAHRKGVIHRDLKPSNILVDHRGEPHLVDFGMAKVAGGSAVGKNKPMLVSITGQVVGTLPYMSPEQAMGDPERVDVRTDIYALGVILYELLTGRFPYVVVGNMRDVLDNIIRADPRPPSSIQRKIDNEVETIILKALSKEPERRYQSAENLGRDLSHYLAGEAIQAKRDSRWYVFRKSAQRHRVGIMSALLVTAVIIIAGGYALLTRQQTSRKIDEARQETMRTAEQLVEQEKVSAVEREARLQAEERIDDYVQKDARQEFHAGINIPEDVKMPPPADATLIDPDATISINLTQVPTSLNPLAAHSDADVIAYEFLFERLFWRTATLELTRNEHLIASLEETDDPRVKLVHLSPGLRWHDGRPLTAEDIVFSWEQTITAEVGSSKHEQARRLQDVHAIDPTTVKFVFEEATPTWKLSMNFEIIPRHLFERHMDDDPTLRRSEYYRKLHHKPIGSGPFQFIKWDDEAILLKRWPNYTGEKPRIDRLSLRWESDPTTILEEFLGGRLDLCTLKNEQYNDDLVFDEAFASAGSRMRHPISTFFFITWNCGAGSPFEDRLVRRAMTHALNVEKILDRVTHNLAVPCYGPWSILTPYFNQDVKRLAFSLKRATELLDEAGWHVGSDGRLLRTNADGVEEPFEFDLMVDSESDRAIGIATIFKEDLAKIGVTVNIFPADWGKEFIPKRNAGQFDALISATSAAVDPGLMQRFYKTGGEFNWGGYHNQQVDDLFAEAAQTLDDHKRAAVFQRLHRLIYQDQPMTFLYQKPSLWAVSNRLRGVSFSVRGPFLFHPGILRWWVPR